MNWQQFKALLNLRWKLSYNAAAKAGKINAALMVVFVGVLLFTSCLAFVVAFASGSRWLSDVDPTPLMFIWDGVIAAFLFFWTIGLVTEVQRSEVILLDKLLHMPLTLREAFILNYASSWVSLSILVFLPIMLGLSGALTMIHGPLAVLNVISVLSFLTMITALTYQFRGWLTRLMLNKRTRGTVVAVITVGFVLLAQLPSAFSVYFDRTKDNVGRTEVEQQARQDLEEQLSQKELSEPEYQEKLAELKEAEIAAYANRRLASFKRAETIGVRVNASVPLGWPAYSVRGIAMQRPLPSLLTSLAMLAIAAGSLSRAYRSTLRTYTLGHSSGAVQSQAKSKTKSRSRDWIARDLPGFSPQVSSVAATTLRNFLRAPQAKMALMMPLIFGVVFGSLFFTGAMNNVPEQLRTFSSLGVLGFVFFGVIQFSSNLFGMDRHGFRAWVLMPVDRRDILLGRNLALFPLAAVQFVLLMAVLQFVSPMSPSHLLATTLQLFTVFLLISIAGNYVSIRTPFAMSPSGTNPAQPKLIPILMQFLVMLFLPLLLVAPSLALGVELLLEFFSPTLGWIPWYLLITIVELGAVIWLYRVALVAQGRMLYQRETQVLAEVASVQE